MLSIVVNVVVFVKNPSFLSSHQKLTKKMDFFVNLEDDKNEKTKRKEFVTLFSFFRHHKVRGFGFVDENDRFCFFVFLFFRPHKERPYR
jgi:hypothetical protein